MRLEFSLLNHIHITTPLFFMNRETRAIAHKWARKLNLTFRRVPLIQNQVQNQNQNSSNQIQQLPPPPTSTHGIYTRPFNPTTDILYTTAGNILDLIHGPFDRLDQPDLNGRGARLDFEIRYLAVSADVVLTDPEFVSDVLEMGIMPEIVYVVVGKQPEWLGEGVGVGVEVGVQRWWGVEGRGLGVWEWDSEKGG
ncbi:hypothetical protein ASPCADRAFT_208213, partial [Aspergillus carbonarius ITEM 5010]